MVQKITELTDEQRAQMKPWAEKWVKIGESCEPADFAAWQEGATDCYRLSEVDWPGDDRVIKVRSPFTLANLAPIVGWCFDNYLLDSVTDFADAVFELEHMEALYVAPVLLEGLRPREDILVSLKKNSEVDPIIGELFDAKIADPREVLTVALTAVVHDEVNEMKASSLEAKVARKIQGAVRDNWRRYLGGQFWVSWQAYTSFFREVCDLELPGNLWEKDQAYAKAQMNNGWWFPHRDYVMVSDRPEKLEVETIDRQDGFGAHQLHCDDGPAMRWRDGFQMWYIHGIRVTEQIVLHPDTLTAAQIRDEANAEVRRIMLDRHGWDTYLHSIGAKLIDEDTDTLGKPRKLWRAEFPDDEALVMVEVINSSPEPDGTFKVYTLRVPPTTTKVAAAVAWTAHFDDAAEYQVAIET